MGLISPGGENLLDFLELRQVLPTYDGTSGTRSGGFIKGQSPCQMLGASLDNSPVDARAEQLVWIRGRNLRFPLQC